MTREFPLTIPFPRQYLFRIVEAEALRAHCSRSRGEIKLMWQRVGERVSNQVGRYVCGILPFAIIR